MSLNAPIAITQGDPAGIGPDLLLTLPSKFPHLPLVLIADKHLLQARAHQLGVPFQLADWTPGDACPSKPVVWHHPFSHPVLAGQPDKQHGGDILQLLDDAANGCLNGTFSAMVTAPLAKHVIADEALPSFSGHTEYLAELAGIKQVVMMLACPGLRVALATTHLPLREVADAIQPDTLETTLRILQHDLQQHFGIQKPAILVLGLNPHAGENGLLGSEEQTIITPLLEKLRQEGMQLTGPLPADTAFNPPSLAGHDAVLAMYHDQGLPVLKFAGFEEGINITLGLPFIRTSVDHGTAFSLAGTGKASPTSLFAAVQQALELAMEQ